MERRYLRYFVAAAELGSVTVTAEQRLYPIAATESTADIGIDFQNTSASGHVRYEADVPR